MRLRGLPEAFEPNRHHYYTSRPVVIPGPVESITKHGLLPGGMSSVPVDPHSTYPGLSSYDRRRVREARIALWGRGPYAHLVPRERELLEAGL